MVWLHDLADPLDWPDDDSFDAALMALVIHHLDDRVPTLREIHRVLRPDGHLVVSTHHPTHDWLRHGGSYFAVEPIEETWSWGLREPDRGSVDLPSPIISAKLLSATHRLPRSVLARWWLIRNRFCFLSV